MAAARSEAVLEAEVEVELEEDDEDSGAFVDEEYEDDEAEKTLDGGEEKVADEE